MTATVRAGSGSAAPSSTHPLDAAPWASLTGPHAHVALGSGLARRYPTDVSPFAAVAAPADPRSWRDLRELYAADEVAVLSGPTGFASDLSSGWVPDGVIPGVQLVATDALRTAPADDAFVVGAADAAEAMELVLRTEPGPFRPRTHELGTYLGLHRDGRLVALAGERLHPEGWTEISAVCTDPAYRRQGLASRLVRGVADLIRARDETPFLHTGAANTRAIDLYLAMGFVLRREVDFAALRAV
jgi:ribosomal protein S18 acetylase RimI-like enzyme